MLLMGEASSHAPSHHILVQAAEVCIPLHSRDKKVRSLHTSRVGAAFHSDHGLHCCPYPKSNTRSLSDAAADADWTDSSRDWCVSYARISTSGESCTWLYTVSLDDVCFLRFFFLDERRRMNIYTQDPGRQQLRGMAVWLRLASGALRTRDTRVTVR